MAPQPLMVCFFGGLTIGGLFQPTEEAHELRSKDTLPPTAMTYILRVLHKKDLKEGEKGQHQFLIGSATPRLRQTLGGNIPSRGQRSLAVGRIGFLRELGDHWVVGFSSVSVVV